MNRRLTYPGAAGDLLENLIERKFIAAAKLDCLICGCFSAERLGKARSYIVDENRTEPGRAIAGDRPENRRGAHGFHHLCDKAIAGAEDQRWTKNAIPDS